MIELFDSLHRAARTGRWRSVGPAILSLVSPVSLVSLASLASLVSLASGSGCSEEAQSTGNDADDAGITGSRGGSAGSGGSDGNPQGGGGGGAVTGTGGAGGADSGARRDASGAPDGGADAKGDVDVNAGSDSGLPGDTYLPWAGGSSYYAKWSHGPSSDPSFFPIAVWLQSPPNASRYKKVGINLFVGLYQGPDENQLSALKSAGVPAFCDQAGVWKAHLDDTTLWGWLQQDEPDNAQEKPGGGGYDPCIATSTIVARYDTMVQGDPTRPVWLGLGRGVSDTMWVGRGTCSGKTEMYPDYAKGADILSFDIYPANGGIGLEAVPNGVDNLRSWSGDTKPVVADIEGSRIDEANPRPTPAQIKSEVWMAIVHGAAGIQYFCHRFTPTFSETDCLDDAATLAALPIINKQVTDLAPILNTPSVGNGVTVASSASDKPIDTMLKRYGGATYLFATEMRDGATTGTFTLRGLPDAASAEVLGENRTIAVASRSFQDQFQSYGVHLYRITY